MLFPSVGGYILKTPKLYFVSHYFPTNFSIVPMATILYSRPILIKWKRLLHCVANC